MICRLEIVVVVGLSTHHSSKPSSKPEGEAMRGGVGSLAAQFACVAHAHGLGRGAIAGCCAVLPGTPCGRVLVHTLTPSASHAPPRRIMIGMRLASVRNEPLPNHALHRPLFGQLAKAYPPTRRTSRARVCSCLPGTSILSKMQKATRWRAAPATATALHCCMYTPCSYDESLAALRPATATRSLLPSRAALRHQTSCHRSRGIPYTLAIAHWP